MRLLERFYKPLSGDILMEQSSIYDFNLKNGEVKSLGFHKIMQSYLAVFVTIFVSV